MQEAPKYDDVFAEVNRYFIEQNSTLRAGGYRKEKLLLDPGFGFGKISPITIHYWRAG